MSEKIRQVAFLVSALLFGGLLLYAMVYLPRFGDYRGPYGDLVLKSCIEQRHTQQGVAAVTFDYRGFDTLGEEFILFAAVAGALLLMRTQRSEQQRGPMDRAEGRPKEETGAAILTTGLVMFPFAFILGIYVILHGHLSPGGGFQGGVLLASSFYFLYLSGEYLDLMRLTPESLLDILEVIGAAGFAFMAAFPVLSGGPFMKNNLPLGRTGELLSAGFLPLFNSAVGIEVGAAFLLLVAAFLKQVVMIRKGRP